MSTTGTFHAAQFTSVRIGCYYHSKYGQLVFSGLTATGSNGFSGQWFPGDGTHDPAALPWDTDADLSALRTAVQYGTIPASRVVWIIGPGVDDITLRITDRYLCFVLSLKFWRRLSTRSLWITF